MEFIRELGRKNLRVMAELNSQPFIHRNDYAHQKCVVHLWGLLVCTICTMCTTVYKPGACPLGYSTCSVRNTFRCILKNVILSMALSKKIVLALLQPYSKHLSQIRATKRLALYLVMVENIYISISV